MASRKQPTKVVTFSVLEADGVPKLFRVVWTSDTNCATSTLVWWRSSESPNYVQPYPPDGPRTRTAAIAAYRKHKLAQADECRRTASEWLQRARECERLANEEVEDE